MRCLSCTGEMAPRECRQLFESGGIVFRYEGTLTLLACDACRVVTATATHAPDAAAPPPELPPAQEPTPAPV